MYIAWKFRPIRRENQTAGVRYNIVPVEKTRSTGHLVTERTNPRTVDIDELSRSGIVDLINGEDRAAFDAVSGARESVSAAVDVVFRSLKEGGRVFFVGAGTSGRLGVLEAAECPPTFGTDSETVQAVMAGGRDAVWSSVEGAEDSVEASVDALRGKKLSSLDALVGIAASAGTPFVASALDYARTVGCPTVLVACNETDASAADVVVTLLCGPEVIVGSTRLKAGTATKMALNTITTASMILLGKTYGNLMVDLQPKSEKLVDRAERIIMDVCGVDRPEARELFSRAEGNVKAAAVMKLGNLPLGESLELLERNGGFLKKALGEASGGRGELE